MLSPFGAHPGNMPYLYDMDISHYQEYTGIAKSKEKLNDYLKRYIFEVEDNKEYLQLIGESRLNSLKSQETSRYNYRKPTD